MSFQDIIIFRIICCCLFQSKQVLLKEIQRFITEENLGTIFLLVLKLIKIAKLSEEQPVTLFS